MATNNMLKKFPVSAYRICGATEDDFACGIWECVRRACFKHYPDAASAEVEVIDLNSWSVVMFSGDADHPYAIVRESHERSWDAEYGIYYVPNRTTFVLWDNEGNLVDWGLGVQRLLVAHAEDDVVLTAYNPYMERPIVWVDGNVHVHVSWTDGWDNDEFHTGELIIADTGTIKRTISAMHRRWKKADWFHRAEPGCPEAYYGWDYTFRPEAAHYGILIENGYFRILSLKDALKMLERGWV